MSEIKLGARVRDIVSGLEGIAVSRLQWLNGCVRYGVQRQTTKDGSIPDIQYVDVEQLKILGEGVEIPLRQTGGDRPSPRSRSGPSR